VIADERIRISLAAHIQTAAPLAVVWSRWALGYNVSEWLGPMRQDNTDAAHGWLVTRRRQTVKRTGIHQTAYTRTYALWAFRLFVQGQADDNSEQRFSAEVDAVEAALLPGTQLQIETKTVRIVSLELSSDITAFGGELAHFARDKTERRHR
jgi:hypothetical protein